MSEWDDENSRETSSGPYRDPALPPAEFEPPVEVESKPKVAWVYVPLVCAFLAIPTCYSFQEVGGLLLFCGWLGLTAIALMGSLIAPFFAPRGHRMMAVVSMIASWFVILVQVYEGLSNFSIQRGRQLFVRSLGRRRAVRPERAIPEAASSQRERAARRWVDNGDSEWVSVAAFSKLSLDLLAVGAPTALVRACHESALEEVRHTELCFELAARLDPRLARHATTQRVPDLERVASQKPTLASLAVDSLVQGAYLEEVSGRVAARLALVASDPEVRATLETIHRDEHRHAEHAWSILAFCIEAGGEEVRAALASHMPLVNAAPNGLDDDLESLGIISPALQEAANKEVRHEVARRLSTLLAGKQTSAAA